MSAFILGLVMGCYIGAVGTLSLGIVVKFLPVTSSIREPWNGVGPLVALIIATGAVFALLNLERVAFASLVLMLLVFVAARLRGILVSWMTLALAALMLAFILPPAGRLIIADAEDQLLVVFFLLCGIVGTRFITQQQQARA